MSAHLQIVALALTAGVFALIVDLVRRRKLMERYALLWLLSTTTLLAFELWGTVLEFVGRAIGIIYPPTTLFLVAFGFVLAILVHFSIVISALSNQNKILAQRVGLLQQQLEEQAVGEGAVVSDLRGIAINRHLRAVVPDDMP